MKPWIFSSLLTLSLVSVAGCGVEASGRSADEPDATSTVISDAGSCVPISCTCGTGTGMRSCDATGQLGHCACPPPALPPPQESTDGDCPTGIYRGNFDGTAGFFVAFTPITGVDFDAAKPPLELTLSAPKGGEFVVYGSGVMRGNANGTFPFEATIMGELDCTTKVFKATLTGSVQLILDGIRNDFTGTMVSNYDGAEHSFVDGMWTVTGSNADGGADFGLTGMGMWHAEFGEGGDGGVDGGLMGVADAGRDAGIDGGP